MRHPPVGVPPGLCYGRRDVALSPGWPDILPGLATLAAPYRPAALWSSPSTRCRLPAHRLAALLRIPLRIDPDLLELDFGTWEGRPWNSVPRDQLDRWAADPLGFAPPGGESVADLLRRVGRVAERLHLGHGNAVVVTHGGPLRLLPALLRGESPDPLTAPPPCGSVTIVKSR